MSKKADAFSYHSLLITHHSSLFLCPLLKNACDVLSAAPCWRLAHPFVSGVVQGWMKRVRARN
jgi:hypothetical protein